MYSLVALSLALGATALSPRSCSFGIIASGGQSGTIGQLDDGQNRIGGGLPPATFTINNGGIIDAAGRGCILTESVEQFQCDQGKNPTYGFAISSNGTLTSSGSLIFYACPASETEWNLYTTPVVGQAKCVEISLTASGCGASSSSLSVSVMTVTVTADNCGVPSSTLLSNTQPGLSATTIPSTVIVLPPSIPESSAASNFETVSTYVVSQSLIQTSTSAVSTALSSTESTKPAIQTIVVSSVAPPPESIGKPEVETSAVISPLPSTAQPVTGSAVSPEVPMTTSTVYISSVYTITSCAATVTNCPSKDSVTTKIISSYTTICPVAETKPTSGPAPTTSAIESTVSLATSKPLYTWTSSAESTLQTKTKTKTWSQVLSNTTSTASASATSSASTCVPTVLSGSSTSGNYQYPHVIVPVNSSSPSTAYGTQYFGSISSSVSTLFNFDIPVSYSGKTCSLIFLLPLQSQLETSSYTFSGNGAVRFNELNAAVSQSTTYDSMPSIEADLGTFTLKEGGSYLIQSFACPVGETLSYEMSAVGDTDLYYFQDWNPSPLGLYITYC